MRFVILHDKIMTLHLQWCSFNIMKHPQSRMSPLWVHSNDHIQSIIMETTWSCSRLSGVAVKQPLEVSVVLNKEPRLVSMSWIWGQRMWTHPVTSLRRGHMLLQHPSEQDGDDDVTLRWSQAPSDGVGNKRPSAACSNIHAIVSTRLKYSGKYVF